MKYSPNQHILFSLFSFLFLFGTEAHSQKDTLHIYYKALQTEVHDSNYVKISEWAKKLKGKHYTVEIFSYYDVSDFKKLMGERAENIQTVVIRKARDFTTIKFSGPVRGKKSQRTVLDIVYSADGYIESVPAITKENNKPAPQPSSTSPAKPANEKAEQKTTTSESDVSENKAAKNEKKASKSESKEVVNTSSGSKYEYIFDTVYVNGVMKVSKKKVKKNK